MTPSQLYVAISILSANQNRFANRHEAGKIALEITDLIQQAKSEWCKEQRNLCAKESLGFFDNKKAFINIILNAPEPN